ncbi:acetate and sugar kinases/Hsc70/actin family protein [Legionella quinlivanii]|uniref:multidrug DMT transporter permease n=1 Tax=Legionella quinlivanii TaxID=45073 RepID=UPI002243EAB4|nr:multidrug DMT transporter permease [Legionella quinlivanii]MCW8450299.1 multidrug DMT transporter permease [Legionella quinlivanii]
MRVVFFLLGCCLFFNSTYAAQENCEQQQCIAIVDAGSTGSRLHVYSYDLEGQTPVNITERYSKKIKPGLATIEANEPTVDAYLTTLFSGAPAYQIPVYFYSTAGMRLLPQPKQQQMNNLVQQWFTNQSQWQLVEAKTITGMDEGMYGWLAINYQLNTLKNESETVGTMDMGGASVQIVFPVSASSEVNSQDIRELDIYGRHFKLFIHSFLGLGQTEVTHQFLDDSVCFANDYQMPAGEKGQGDAYVCEGEISSLMNAVHHVNRVVQPALQANPVKNWYVMGGLVDLAKSQPFNYTEQEFNNQSLLDEANSQICQQQWGALNSQFPGNEYLYGYCLFPAYYYALMVDGYGLNSQQPLHYLGADKSSDWTIGVVLQQPQKDSQTALN